MTIEERATDMYDRDRAGTGLPDWVLLAESIKNRYRDYAAREMAKEEPKS